jgi:peptidoglycan/xylan/chitin deacetylase (PgdA/CDA1 family)
MRAFVRSAVKHAAAAVDRLRPPAHGLVVLIYHRVGGRYPAEADLSRSLFVEQMAMLAQHGSVVSLDTATALLRSGSIPDEGAVVITFDDGTADFADVAMPVLVDFSLPATLYATTAFIDENRAFPSGAPALSWDALRDAVASGLVTVGSHTHTHALLDRLAPAAIGDELDRSRGLIGDRLGVAADHFAYPKAVAGSAAADAAVRKRFVTAALAGTRPNVAGDTDLHQLARSPIQRSDGMRWFQAKLRGGMSAEDVLRSALNRRRYADLTS